MLKGLFSDEIGNIYSIDIDINYTSNVRCDVRIWNANK